MAKKQGILIAVEGIDGTGKTTQVSRLLRTLTNAGEHVIASKEPTDGQWGRAIRATAASGRLPLSEELDLFVRDRKEHLAELVIPALNDGKIVILDRYFYSTIAYQGSRGATPEQVEALMQFAPIPDMVLLLDADPHITLHRISNHRNEIPNEFEKESSLRECREVFLALANRRSEIHLIDSTKSADAVEREILDLLLENSLRHKRCAKRDGCDVFFCRYRETGTCNWAELKSKIGNFFPATH